MTDIIKGGANGGVERRTIIKAAAWAAPVVAIAATAPLAAASNTPPREWGDPSVTNQLVYRTQTGLVDTTLGASIEYYDADKWQLPTLIATYRGSGFAANWAFALGAGTTGQLTEGGSITRNGAIWQVTSISADTLVLTSVSGVVDGSGVFSAPNIKLSGTYTGNGTTDERAQAYIGLSGAGVPGVSNTSAYPN